MSRDPDLCPITSNRTQIWISSVVPPFLEIWRKRESVLFSDTLWVPWHTGDTYLCIKDIKKCILHDRSPFNILIIITPTNKYPTSHILIYIQLCSSAWFDFLLTQSLMVICLFTERLHNLSNSTLVVDIPRFQPVPFSSKLIECLMPVVWW